MLNERKVRLMTKMAIYNRSHKIEKKSAAKSFKTDYVTFGVLKTVFAATFAYIILAGLYILYYSGEFLENINAIDYETLGKDFLTYYCIFLVVYIVAALLVYSVKYDRSRAELKKYYANLKKLEKFSDK